MSDLRICKTFALLISLLLLISACGPAQESAIATSVVQTVQAGQSLTQLANVATAAPTLATQTLETPLASASTPTTAATLASAPPIRIV